MVQTSKIIVIDCCPISFTLLFSNIKMIKSDNLLQNVIFQMNAVL